MQKEQSNFDAKNTVPTGTIRSFGEYGVNYVVYDVNSQLPDGDWLVNVEVLDTGEKFKYKLSKIIKDPKVD